MNKDFFQALDELESEKKINKEQFIETLETALASAYKKMYGEAKSALVKLNPEKNTIKIYSYKTVVEEVEDEDKQISVEEAKKIKSSYKAGDTILQEESTKEFGRIAAQTAQQVVMQRLKELERQIATSEMSEKEDELLTAIIKRIDQNIVYVQIAGSHTEGVLLEKDQIPNEKYVVGERIKVYVKRIKDGYSGLQIQVSRSNVGFVHKLFELEIPEVQSGEVIVKSIARDAGKRCKVAVYSEKPNVDALGACVGMRGQRINTISAELNGEKVDLVPYTDDILEYIASALSPASVLSVETNESLRASRVVVPDNQLSLAIGKGGQNVRLASRLTGWKIDIKPESEVSKSLSKQADDEARLEELARQNEITDFDGFDDIE
ncbi:MAG: transcription termination/antitermination protein NusA [Clostridia bacterium]|nr:transcription termination/antitermination protein NusA [Clostridia bacterium]MBR2433088.1 transcription termination/antitermination protein NusA [Clostridia bacterium]MBR3790206.1 transcription termination/antitermination protein NusA [Clostridia bacterium]